MKIELLIEPATNTQEEWVKNVLLPTLAIIQGQFHGKHKKNYMTINYSPEWNPAHDTDFNTENVNRVEVIDHSKGGTGRDYVKWEDKLEVKLMLQDSNRTLKVFISNPKNEAVH